MSKQPTYDLFVSYANADSAWVEGFLLPELGLPEEQVMTKEDFRLGADKVDEFVRAVTSSRYTVLVFSPAFLTDVWTTFSRQVVAYLSVEEQSNRLIPLLLRPGTPSVSVNSRVALECLDEANWKDEVARLRRLLDQPEPAEEKITCPYPGMRPFREEESEYFYGREREIQSLLQKLRLHPFLAVIGPSGSGKSSLILAGLVPALKHSPLFGAGNWLVRILRPGEKPMVTLTAVLHGNLFDLEQSVADLLAAHSGAQRLLLVVDQFEELFAVAQEGQLAFQQTLVRLSEVSDCFVVLTLRADFYGNVMMAPIWGAIQAHREEVLPLGAEGLRQAIVQPAKRKGVFIEPLLVERLVDEAAGEFGLLPFLQETLLLLWEKLERRYLPISAYKSLSGESRSENAQLTGLQVAMTRQANAAWAHLSPEQQAIALRIFLRLVQFGQKRADTRRQQSVTALRSADDDDILFEETVRHLTDSRLLILSSEGETDGAERQVDIAHEALITGWPTLRQWTIERREAEQTRRRLEAKATEWKRLGGSGGLLDEVELLEAERWLASSDAAELGYRNEFVALVQASRTAQEKAAVQQHRIVRLGLGAVGVIVVLVIAVLLVYEVGQSQLAEQEREAVVTIAFSATNEANAREDAEEAARKESEAREATEKEARIATARELAVQAQLTLEEYPQRTLLLALEALLSTMRENEPPVLAAEQALRDALANSGGFPLPFQGAYVRTMTVSPDNRWLVTGHGLDENGNGIANLWDLTAEDPVAQPIGLQGHKETISAVAVSSNNHWLVTGSWDGTARLWDLTANDPAAQPIILTGHESGINAVAISSDNRWIVTGSHDNTARLWKLSADNPAANPLVLTGHEEEIGTVAISSDNHWLVTGSRDNTARLWDLRADDPAANPILLTGHEEPIGVIAISPDNHWLVTGSGDSTARLWDLTADNPADHPIILTGHGGQILAMAFSPDNHWLAIGSVDGSVRLWDLSANDLAASSIPLTGHRETIWGIAISSDSHWLATGSADKTARLWDLTADHPAANPIILKGHEDWIRALAFTPDNQWLATGGFDQTIRLWELAKPLAQPLVLTGHEKLLYAIAMSSDSRWLVTLGFDGARLWDLTAEKLSVHSIGDVNVMAFSSDNQWLVTSHFDGSTHLWDLTKENPSVAPLILADYEGAISAMAFSPDNHWLATGSFDGSTYLWDLTAEEPFAHSIRLQGHERAISAIAFSSDNHWLVTGSEDKSARLWDLTAKDFALHSFDLRGHKGDIDSVAFSPDSHWLVTASAISTTRSHNSVNRESSWDQTARLWDLTAKDPSLQPIVLTGHSSEIGSVAISSDNHWLVTASSQDRTARLWNLSADDPTTNPIIFTGHEDGVNTVAFTPDNHWLVTAGGRMDRTARLWDLTASEPTAQSIVLTGHSGPIEAVAISPNNHWLVTASVKTLRLWELQLSELIALACRTAGRNLTQEEWTQYFRGQEYRNTCPDLPAHPSVLESLE